jgi:hypothetical protein
MNQDQTNIDLRYRSMMIIWFGIFMSFVGFFVLTRLSPVEPTENRSLALALSSLGLAPVALSFLLKQKLLDKAVQNKNVIAVQQAYVLAYALCEAAALLGVLCHFLTGSTYYYAGFIIAGLGMLLHFPKKQHLLAASGLEF